MKNLITTPCLILAVFNRSMGMSWSVNTATKDWNTYSKGDYATALRELKTLAEQGNGNAQSTLGIMYVFGQGILQDYTRTHIW
jgi:TPR repeat protein